MVIVKFFFLGVAIVGALCLLFGCSSNPYCVEVKPGQTVINVQPISNDDLKCVSYTKLTGAVTCSKLELKDNND